MARARKSAKKQQKQKTTSRSQQKKAAARKPAQPKLSVVTSGAVLLTRERGHLHLVVHHTPADAASPAIRKTLESKSGGNCPSGGHCKTIWVGQSITCQVLEDCKPPCVCHVWGAPAGEDLKDLGKDSIDDAKTGWLYQCYCTEGVEL
jgi:hypothetical protein